MATLQNNWNALLRSDKIIFIQHPIWHGVWCWAIQPPIWVGVKCKIIEYAIWIGIKCWFLYFTQTKNKTTIQNPKKENLPRQFIKCNKNTSKNLESPTLTFPRHHISKKK